MKDRENRVETFSDRLRSAMLTAGLNQTALSAKTGIAQSTIATALQGARGSSDTAVYANACGVDALWLTTGEGSMLGHRSNQVVPAESTEALNTVADRVRWARRRMNVSGEDLAKLTGSSQGNISKLENGLAAYPSAEYVFPLADALQVSARWLLTGVEADGLKDAPMQIPMSEDLKRLMHHIQTLEEQKVDGLFAILGVKRS